MEAAPNREHIRNMAEARAHVKRDGGCYIRPEFVTDGLHDLSHVVEEPGAVQRIHTCPERSVPEIRSSCDLDEACACGFLGVSGNRIF